MRRALRAIGDLGEDLGQISAILCVEVQWRAVGGRDLLQQRLRPGGLFLFGRITRSSPPTRSIGSALIKPAAPATSVARPVEIEHSRSSAATRQGSCLLLVHTWCCRAVGDLSRPELAVIGVAVATGRSGRGHEHDRLRAEREAIARLAERQAGQQQLRRPRTVPEARR